MRIRFIAPLAMLLCLAACGQEPTGAQHPHAVVLPAESVPLGRLPQTVVPQRYRVALSIDPTKATFSGHVEIDVVFAEKRRTIFLHGQGLNVLGASVRLSAKRSVPAHYMQVDRSGVARLLFVDEIPSGKATLVFDYEAPFGKSLSGLYKVIDRGDAYAFTQFESTSAREAFPSFDEPGFKTPFHVTVTAPTADKVVGNTPIEATRPDASGLTRTDFQWTRPLPTYLIALAVGPLDIVDGGDIPADQYRRRPLHLRGVTARGNGPRIQYALSLTPRIILALENYFQIGYPFQKLDILAVPDFSAGAMENAGAVTFRERLLLMGPNAPIDQKRSSLTVQAHELTHQWFGDLVTPSWWDNTWLNESFATWMEYKAAQAVLPQQQFDTETLRGGFDVMDLDELPSAREIHQPVKNTDDIENAFDSITYDKGASVLAMYEAYLGEDVFRRGIHTYLQRFSFANATADDFIGTIAATAASAPHNNAEEVTIRIDRNGAITWNDHRVANEAAVIDQMSHMSANIQAPQIVGSFKSFIDQPGVPYLQLRTKCDAASAFAHVTQAPFAPIGGTAVSRQWQVPMCLSGAGSETICRLVDRKAADVLLGSSCPETLLPNVGGKGYYRFALDDTGWQKLIAAAPKAPPAEQITLLHNLYAGLRAGRASAADLFATMRALGPVARWDVLDAIDTTLKNLRNQAISDQNLPAFQTFVRTNFAPRLAPLGLVAKRDETPSDALARERLATLLVTEGRDPGTITSLAKAADSYLSGDTAALAPEIIAEAMRAGLLAGGPPFADRLIKAFASSNDEFFRRQLVYAFAGSDDPAVIKKLLAVALTPRMRTGELRYLYEYMAEEPVARHALWGWFTQNFDAILARVSAQGMRRPVSTLERACDAGAQAALNGFFGPRTNELTGTKRPLAEANERISRCIAFRKAKGQEVAAALQTHSLN
jgi:alanyl aminopeptidase